MDPLILRPIITAIIEYALFGYVLKKGKFFPKVIAGILFFLASYQLGEVIFLLTDNKFGIQLSYASTSILPSLGVLLIERLKNRSLGSIFIFGTASAFSIFFLAQPDLITGVEKMHCFTKLLLSEESHEVFYFFIIYYIGTLGISCILLLHSFLTAKDRKLQDIYGWTLLAYLSFFPFSIIIIALFGVDAAYLASIMCGLAIFAAGIMSWMSLTMHEPVRYRG